MTPPRSDPRAEPPTPRPLPAIRPKAFPPDEKPTVEVDGIEILKGMLREMREDMRSEFRSTNANIQVVSHDVTTLKNRVGTLERWRADEEGRARRNSERVQAIDDRSSSNDLAHEANIAAIRVDVESTKKKVDTVLLDVGLMAVNVNKIVASPKAKMAASAIIAWLLGYLASKGLSIPALQ